MAPGVEMAYHDVHGKLQAIVDENTTMYEGDQEDYQRAKTTVDKWSRTLPPNRTKLLEAELKGKEGTLAIKMEGKQIAEADLRSVQEAMAALHQRPALAEVWAALRAKEQQEVEGGGEEKQDMEVSAMQQALPPGSFFGRVTAAFFGGSA